MNLCSDGHEEVCYESRHCPMCELVKERDDLLTDLESQMKTNDSLCSEIDDLKAERDKDPTVKWIEAHQKTVDKTDNT